MLARTKQNNGNPFSLTNFFFCFVGSVAHFRVNVINVRDNGFTGSIFKYRPYLPNPIPDPLLRGRGCNFLPTDESFVESAAKCTGGFSIVIRRDRISNEVA